MFFKSTYIIEPLNLGKANEVSIDIRNHAGKVRVTLQEIPRDKRSDKYNANDLMISAMTERELTPKRAGQFAEIGPTLSNSLKQFAIPIMMALYDAIIQTIKAYRWRLRSESATSPIKWWLGITYSADGESWKQLPSENSFVFQWGLPVKQEYSDEEFSSIGQLLSSGDQEPLGHDLLHEAWSLRRTNPRSSLVIGMAAAETGFKQFCTKLAPDASWLIENVPSPPLIKMLEEYLPLLKTKNNIYGHTLPPPEELTDSLKKGVNLRNAIVHGKPTDLKKETVEEVLNATRDLLYLLDFYNGYAWAWEHVDGSYLTAMVDAAKAKNGASPAS